MLHVLRQYGDNKPPNVSIARVAPSIKLRIVDERLCDISRLFPWKASLGDRSHKPSCQRRWSALFAVSRSSSHRQTRMYRCACANLEIPRSGILPAAHSAAPTVWAISHPVFLWTLSTHQPLDFPSGPTDASSAPCVDCDPGSCSVERRSVWIFGYALIYHLPRKQSAHK